MKVIAVHTYAGSLILGAMAAKHKFEVIASYEDEKGWGLDVQKLNFAGSVPLISARNPRYWGSEFEHLRDTIVIAHPPCSWASPQNNSASKRGLQSDAFKCTIDVLEFATNKQAAAILIESVVPAMDGAKEIHEGYAEKHGYDLFRVIQNAKDFGAPQIRERFWAIFIRKDLSDGRLRMIKPTGRRTIGDVVRNTTWNDPWDVSPSECRDVLIAQLNKWQELGVPGVVVDEIMAGKRGYGMVNTKIDGSKNAGNYQFFKFGTRNLRLLDPNGYANTLLSDSFWAVPMEVDPEDVVNTGGRLVTIGEYCQIMGFPPDYKWPEKQLRGGFRAYLSKGVCPPVASWMLDQTLDTILNNTAGDLVAENKATVRVA